MIARTSIETYHDLRREGALGERQRFVLDLVRRFPGRTAIELTALAASAPPSEPQEMKS